MIRQERPTWREADDDDDKSDGSGYGSSKPVRPTPSYAPQPRPVEQPPAVPMEGIIAWRRQDQDQDLWGKSEKTKGHEDDNDDDDEDEPEDKPSQTVAPAAPASAVKKAEESREVAVEGIEDDPDAALLAPEQSDDNVFVYPEEASPAKGQEEETSYPNAPVEAAAAPAPAHSAEVPPYYRSAPNPAEAAAAYPQNPDDYERAAAQPPAPPNNPPPETAVYAQPPEQQRYGYAYNPAMHPPQPTTEYAPVQQAPNVPVERVPADNHRHGEPLAAAVGIGLVAEHFWNRGKHKGHQKQVEHLAQQGVQQQREASSYHMRASEQQRSLTAEQQRQAAEMQRLREAQERQFAVPTSPYVLEQAPTPQYQQPRTFEPVPGGPARTSPEGLPHQRLERVPQVPVQHPEQHPDEIAIEAPELKPQQHVEHSAWHNIVVDKHGHEVHDAIRYGQEFYRQREHEMLQDRVSGSPAGTAGGAAAGQQHGQPVLPPMYQQGTLPSGMTSPTLPPGHPTHIDPQHQLPAAPSKQSSGISPWFWVMLALIVAAFFTAALI
jgi:hypothetical protein